MMSRGFVLVTVLYNAVQIKRVLIVAHDFDLDLRLTTLKCYVWSVL